MLIKENVWDNEFHEDLFKLFILASNSYLYIYPNGELTNLSFVEFVWLEIRRNFQFSDRAVCEEEFEGYTFITPDEFKKSYMILRPQRASKDQLKIKFRFVENEND